MSQSKKATKKVTLAAFAHRHRKLLKAIHAMIKAPA